MKIAALSASTIARPAEPVKPVSQASRCERRGTYSPWCSSARGTTKPSRPRRFSSARSAASRSPVPGRRRAVIGLRQLCPPRGQRLGQFGVGLGVEQFDPFGPGQPFGRRGDAAHQGVERGRIGSRPRWRSRWRTSSGAELMALLFMGRGDPKRGAKRGKLSNNRSPASAKCQLIVPHAQEHSRMGMPVLSWFLRALYLLCAAQHLIAQRTRKRSLP